MNRTRWLILGVLTLTVAGTVYYQGLGQPPKASERPPPEPPQPRDGEPEAITIAPADSRPLQDAGTRDSENTYASTVMVTAKGPLELAECSGVIVSPKLVLTAGHCVCKPTANTRSINRSTCHGTINAMTVFQGPVGSTLIADVKVHVYPGTIHPHPELQLVFDASGAVLSAHANLAVIRLDEPIKPGTPIASLAEMEVQTGEPLVMAGFGYDKDKGGLYGARYYRTNKVVTPQEPSNGRFIYEQQGPFTYNGFDGGPCFREEGNDRKLVGIASAGTEKELPLMSTVFFGDWIRSEIRRAAQ